jgi:DNA-binding GntR family transcriptional regulator
MIGLIFMFIASQVRMIEDWQESLLLYEQLVAMFEAKDVAGASRSIEAHLQHSLDLSLSAFIKKRV